MFEPRATTTQPKFRPRSSSRPTAVMRPRSASRTRYTALAPVDRVPTHGPPAKYDHRRGAHGRYGDDGDEFRGRLRSHSVSRRRDRSARPAAIRRRDAITTNDNNSNNGQSSLKNSLVWLSWAAAAAVAAVRIGHVPKGGKERGRARERRVAPAAWDARGRDLARHREKGRRRSSRAVAANPAASHRRCEGDCDYYLRRQPSRVSTSCNARRGRSVDSGKWGFFL